MALRIKVLGFIFKFKHCLYICIRSIALKLRLEKNQQKAGFSLMHCFDITLLKQRYPFQRWVSTWQQLNHR
jgi:hypothetical protein